ncbi:protein PHTF2-like [Diadema antillarum]|uniref:protein PHTF2-like n=1 Tax=Diadema antillarum TaxID=105358 RepID=UPI003A86F969
MATAGHQAPARDNLNDAIAHFQQQIGAYDKELWEEHVEQKESQGLGVNVSGVNLKTGRVKTELIDVDLVRGSTFTKAKPEHAWFATTRKGLLRVFFFPFYYSWWRQQLSRSTFFSLLVLYFLQGLCITIFVFYQSTSEEQAIYPFEVYGPILLMLVLGTTYTQVVSTNARTKSLLRKSSRRNLHRSKNVRAKGSSTKAAASSRSSPQKSRDGRGVAKAGSPKSKAAAAQKLNHASAEKKKETAGPSRSSNSTERGSPLEGRGSPAAGRGMKNKSGEVAQNEENAEKEDKEGHAHYVPSSAIEEVSECVDEDFTLLNTPADEMEVTGDILIGESPREFDHELEDIIQASYRKPNTTEAYRRRPPTGQPAAQSQRSNVILSAQNGLSGFSAKTLRESKKSRLNRVSILEKARKFSPVEEESPQDTSQAMSDSEGPPSDNTSITQGEGQASPQPRGRSITRKGRRSRTRQSGGSLDSEGDTSPDTRLESEKYFQPISRPVDSDLDEGSWEETGAEGSSFSSDSGNTDDDDDGSTTVDDEEEEEDKKARVEGEVRAQEVVDSHFEDPFKLIHSMVSSSSVSSSGLNKVRVRIFEDDVCKKTDMSVLQISCAINNKVHSVQASTDYVKLGFIFSFVLAIIPLWYRLQNVSVIDTDVPWLSCQWPVMAIDMLCQMHWAALLVTVVTSFERFYLSSLFFFLISVAERTYKQRCLFAKYFSHLTSARRARQSSLPHFRLDRVSNIKAWLSLRSFLKKRGPQRSVNVIVSSACLVTLMLVSILCSELLHSSRTFLAELYNWEVVAWTFCLSPFLLRFITLGSDINKKFRNTSVLLTEQINLYLNMERKPHKKDDLMLANNVLKLASKLLKEVETPFKLSGLSMNPVLYNITRVLVLSAFSGVLTELLGFKLKLWKIKA